MNGSCAITHGRIVAGAFKPHPLVANRHLQTILPAFCRPRPPAMVDVERLELEDGDFVDLGWIDGSRTRSTGPLLVMIHGLGGSFESKYALGLGHELACRGWRTVIFKLRGAGPEPNRLARCYHHGDTADFHHICALLKQRHPEAELYGAGWSLGASVLLKALGEKAGASLLTAAAAGSAPFVLEASAEHLRHGVARLYQSYLMREICKNLPKKHRNVALPKNADLQAALSARDFFAFDNAYTAPINGFENARDYYRRSACGQFLKTVARPTLIVNALDDPLMASDIVPPPTSLAPSVYIETCKHGGHVGFIAAGPHLRFRYWLEERFIAFFESQRNGNQVASP